MRFKCSSIGPTCASMTSTKKGGTTASFLERGIGHHHVIALKLGSKIHAPAHKPWKTIKCTVCDAQFSVRTANGIVPSWSGAYYLARLDRMLASALLVVIGEKSLSRLVPSLSGCQP